MTDLLKEFLMNVVILIVLTVGLYVIQRYAKVKLHAIVNTLIQLAEAQIVGSNLGAAKKEWVLTQLAIAGVKVNEEISDLIDELVEFMNDHKTSILDAVKEQSGEIVNN